jgi:imidazolonepropionase-like amidohydrolase
MGNVAGYRAAFIEAPSTRRSATRPTADKDTGGKRDLKLDTLAGAMAGDILVHIHCYRADEMATMIDLANEFGFRIAAFHHGVEAYKLADRLAAEEICGALWADWWGFKMEASTASRRTSRWSTAPRAVARSCIRIRPRASSGSTRKRRR